MHHSEATSTTAMTHPMKAGNSLHYGDNLFLMIIWVCLTGLRKHLDRVFQWRSKQWKMQLFWTSHDSQEHFSSRYYLSNARRLALGCEMQDRRLWIAYKKLIWSQREDKEIKMRRKTSVLIRLLFGVIVKGVSMYVSGSISDVWSSVQEYLGDSIQRRLIFWLWL